jgi:nucleoside-diphosphate-sugar epimerase
VIHTAGIAHAMSGLPEDDYRSINTEATTKLAQSAQRAGVKRFVFLSSIRAQVGSTAEYVVTEALDPRPTDSYGKSKLAAEQALAALDLDWVALRLVLVYGPGVKGNMARLMRLARSSFPLPLLGIRARRSLLSLDNLTGAIEKVLISPERLQRPIIVSDPEPVTVPEMIAAMRQGARPQAGTR